MEASARDFGIYDDYTGHDYITIENLEIKQFEEYGIYSYGGDYWIIDDCTIHHCGVIEGATDDNIMIEAASDIAVKNCTIYEGGSHGIFIYSGDSNIIENNEVYNNHHSNIDIQRPDATSCDANIIRYNEVYFATGYDSTGTGNSIYLEGTSGNNVTNTEIYYNLVYNEHENAHTGIQVYAYSEGTVLYNNVFYDSTTGSLGIYLNNGALSVTVKNNIAKTSSYTYGVLRVVDSTNKTIDYNCWDVDSGSLVHINDLTGGDGPGFTEAEWASYKSESGFDANSINSDPLMTDPANDDFTLQAGSPCIDAGTHISYIGIDSESSITGALTKVSP